MSPTEQNPEVSAAGDFGSRSSQSSGDVSAAPAPLERPDVPDPNRWLGKIIRAEFGFGGYDDAQFGLTLTFEGGYGTTYFVGTWATRPDWVGWTVEQQRGHFADAVEKLRDTLLAAKKKHVAELVGIPVEVTCENFALKSWRVLTEVL